MYCNNLPFAGYNGGAVLVQGAYGEPATEFYKVLSIK